MNFLPQDILNLTYSNVAKLFADYDVAKTYIVEFNDGALTDDSVALYKNYLYRSTSNDNLGEDPVNSTKWNKYAISNRDAMIDLQSQTRTIQTQGTDLIVEFERGFIETLGIGNYEASQIIIEHLTADNGVISGLTIPTSVDLDATISAGLAYVDNIRQDTVATLKTFTASKDTYVDLDNTGTFVYTEVANGAGAPALTDPNQRIAKVVTDVDNITSVEDLRTVIDNVIATSGQSIAVSPNEEVIDYWSYIYEPYSIDVDRVQVFTIDSIGEYIRVTFIRNVDSGIASCGFLIGGQSVNMGETLVDDIGFGFNSYSSKTTDPFGTVSITKRAIQDLVDFQTIIAKADIAFYRREVKKIIDEIGLFVLDPRDDSPYENLATLGTVADSGILVNQYTQSIISWSIYESV